MVYSSYLRKSTTNADKEINVQMMNSRGKAKMNQHVALINKHKSSIGFHYSRQPQQATRTASRNMLPHSKMTNENAHQKVKAANHEIFNKVLHDLSAEQNLISSSTQKRNKRRITGLQSAKSNSQIPVTPSSNKTGKVMNMQFRN